MSLSYEFANNIHNTVLVDNGKNDEMMLNLFLCLW